MNNRKFNNIIAILVVIALAVGVYTVKNLVWNNDEDNYDTMQDEGGFFEDASGENEGLRETVLYYKNDNGFIVPVMRKLPWPEDKAIAKATLQNMIDDIALREDIGSIGLLPIIPAGTRVNGMSINEGLCRVDFSSEILNYESIADEEAIVTGIVYALTEFPTISEVQIMIDGKIANELTHGTKVSNALARKDINLLDKAASGQTKVVVYYKGTTNGVDEYYVPVTIPTNAPNENVYTVLEKLFEGPDEYIGLYTDIPMSTELLGVQIDDGTAYINVTEESKQSLKDQVTFEAMTKNIALSLEQFNEISNIEILIDGSSLEEAGLEVVEPALPTFANEY